jgi:hypothetical protein
MTLATTSTMPAAQSETTSSTTPLRGEGNQTPPSSSLKQVDSSKTLKTTNAYRYHPKIHNYSTFPTPQESSHPYDECHFWSSQLSLFQQLIRCNILFPWKLLHVSFTSPMQRWRRRGLLCAFVVLLLYGYGQHHFSHLYSYHSLSSSFLHSGEYQWDHYAYNPHLSTHTTTTTSNNINVNNNNSSSTSNVYIKSHVDNNSQGMIATVAVPIARTLLVAQWVGLSQWEPYLEISSRPNRAYARLWNRDYVRYWGYPTTIRSCCWDKVQILKDLTHSSTSTVDASTPSTPSSSTTSTTHSTAITTSLLFTPLSSTASFPYDVVALLPPDGMFVDLDYDVLQLLPPGYLMAVSTHNDIVLFHLHHPYAALVARTWYDLTRHVWLSSCPNSNTEWSILQQALMLANATHLVYDLQQQHQQQSNMDTAATAGDNNSPVEDAVDTESNIINFDISSSSNNGNDDVDTSLGYIQHNGTRVFKALPMASSSSSRAAMLLSNRPIHQAVLQTTADSICYRYYPRCEVP